MSGPFSAAALALLGAGLLAEPEVPLEPAPLEDVSPAEAAPQADPDTVRTVLVQTQADGMTASGRTITHAQIDATPKRSAEDILRLVPGLHIVQHGSQGKGYQFYLRGFDAVHGADIETLLEDIPINEASNVHAHGYLDLAFIIPEVVSGVDAEKGSLRLGQGNFGTAGSLRYRLGVPERGTHARYEFGSTGRHRASVVHAPHGMSEDTFVAVEALHDAGYGSRRQAQRLSTMAQAQVFSRRGTDVTVFGSAYGARFQLPGVVRIDDVSRGAIGLTGSYTDDQIGESDRAIASVRVRSQQDRVRTRVTAYANARRLMLDENFTGDLLFEEQGDRHQQRHSGISPGIRGEVAVRVHPRVEIPVYASWHADFIQQSVDQLNTTGEIWDTSQDLGISQHLLGVGTGVRASPTDWMRIEAGGRVDALVAAVDEREDDTRSSGTTMAISPRLLTRFTPGERWQLFAGYGRGFRTPEARAFTQPQTAAADEDLSRFAGGRSTMTLTDNVEVGTRVQPTPIVDLGLATFGTWIARESVFDHVSGFNIELSGTRRLGAEADVVLHATEWLELGGDVTYAHARFVESGNPIPGAPPLVVSTKATVLHPRGFRAGVRWFLLGRRPLSYGATAGVATVIDANIGYRYHWFQVDLSVDNVLGQDWREGEYHFASHWDAGQTRSQIPTVHAVAGNPFTARLAVTAHF